MTREEARIWLITKREELMHKYMFKEAEVLTKAIDSLKAQDRPIICPRCGRTFSEAEGRESKEIQGLEYAENILENILREQEGSEE